jgi:hypothetical protein
MERAMGIEPTRAAPLGLENKQFGAMADPTAGDIPDSHGAQEAVLLGDPEKPGMYVVRVKFPPHVMDSPHWHPNARYVTVLEGTWYAGTGTICDRALFGLGAKA